MQEIEESYIQQYQSVAPPLLAISKQIQKRLQRVFKDMSFTGKESALLMGRRIEPRLLMDREGRFSLEIVCRVKRNLWQLQC